MIGPLEQLSVNPEHGVTLAHQIKQQITLLIAGGKLQPGDRLPAVRSLAKQLSVNLHTVRNAYRMLVDEGLLEMRQGRGAHVLAYDPRRLAQIAAAVRSHTVGLILPSYFNPFYHALLQGIAEAADQDRTLLFTCFTQDDPAEAWRYYAQLAARQVDGIITISTPLEISRPSLEQNESRLPLVSVDWPEADGPSVNLDLESAGYLPTRHLILHGYQRIGLITVEGESANVRPVNAGYRRALENAGYFQDPDLVVSVAGFDIPAGFDGARRLLGLPQPPRAIFAITDLMAVGALQAIRSAGLRVPQDVALAGFNDISLARLVDPPLTSVAAPAHAMGLAAMHLLQELIAGRRPTRSSLVFPTHLVIRDSCGAHP